MRTIKYQCYDKKLGLMFQVHEIQFDPVTSLPVRAIGYSEPPNQTEYMVYGGYLNKGYKGELRFYLREWTGLKDKNQKEIYEGDLVKFFDQPIYADVKWDDFSGAFRLHGLNGWQDSQPWFSLEVIGNIFQGVNRL